MTYDDADQFTAEQRSGADGYNHNFVYDPAGNRTLKNEDGARTTYTYDAANQIQTADDGSGVITYLFDADGNQEVSIHPPLPKRVTVTWDFENRPVEYRYPGGDDVVTLGYDPENRLVDWESDSMLGDTLLWDGQQILQERREELGPKHDDRFYTLEPAGFGNLVSERREVTEDSQATEQTLYYHYDALGSTRQLASGGETVGDFLWDAWGFGSVGTTDISFG